MAKCRNCSSISTAVAAPLTLSHAGSAPQGPELCSCPVLSTSVDPGMIPVASGAPSLSPLPGVSSLQLGPSAMWSEVLIPAGSRSAWLPVGLRRMLEGLCSLRKSQGKQWSSSPTFCSAVYQPLSTSLQCSGTVAQPLSAFAALTRRRGGTADRDLQTSVPLLGGAGKEG